MEGCCPQDSTCRFNSCPHLMGVEEYLKQKLETCGQYILTDLDRQILDTKGIEEYIFGKLMSKKFRKWAAIPGIQEKVRTIIHYCVSNNKPIQIDFSFGGFKLWRLPTAPEVDWSEFVSIAYTSDYVAPILAAYSPGIFVDFSSADIAVSTVNNVPRADVDCYYASFKKILESFRPHFPRNLTMDITRLRDLFKDEKDFIEQVEPHLETFRKELDADPVFKEELRRGAIQNIQTVHGVEDLSKLSDEEMEEVRIYSSEIAEGLYATAQVQEKWGPDRIFLLATKQKLDIPCIMIGTTRHSSAKFWAGIGVLARDGDGYADFVLTPKQWDDVKDAPHETVKTDLISLKNFGEIRIYPQKFNFSMQK